MRRGLSRGYSDNCNSRSQQDGERRRRPCRIEERLRLRRHHHRVKSPEKNLSRITENKVASTHHVVSLKPAKLDLNSDSTSSSSTPKGRNSKQRVDLLDQAFQRMSCGRTMDRKDISKLQKDCSRRHRSPVRRMDVRPRSAPCTPLFKIKYAKHKCGRDIFVDYKVVQKDCIDVLRKASPSVIGQPIVFQDSHELKTCKSQEYQWHPTSLGASKPFTNQPHFQAPNGEDYSGQVPPPPVFYGTGTVNELPVAEAIDGSVKDTSLRMLDYQRLCIPSSLETSINVLKPCKSQEFEPKRYQLVTTSYQLPIAINTAAEVPLVASTGRPSTPVQDTTVERPLKSHVFKWQTILEKRHQARRPVNASQPGEERPVAASQDHQVNTICKKPWKSKSFKCRQWCMEKRQQEATSNQYEQSNPSSYGVVDDRTMVQHAAAVLPTMEAMDHFVKPCQNKDRQLQNILKIRHQLTSDHCNEAEGLLSGQGNVNAKGNDYANGTAEVDDTARSSCKHEHQLQGKDCNVVTHVDRGTNVDINAAEATGISLSCPPTVTNIPKSNEEAPTKWNPVECMGNVETIADKDSNRHQGHDVQVQSGCHGCTNRCHRQRNPEKRQKSSPRRVSFCLPFAAATTSADSGKLNVIRKMKNACPNPGMVAQLVAACAKAISGVQDSSELVNESNRQESKNENEGRSSTVQSKLEATQVSNPEGEPLRVQFRGNLGEFGERCTKSPRGFFCKEILNRHQDMLGSYPYVGSHLGPTKNSDSRTSVSSAKDWALDAEDNSCCSSMENISFPKETRQAMNVLMNSRENLAQDLENGNDLETGQQLLKEVRVLDTPDLGIFNSIGHKAMHVATYAQALAVFQKTCDPLAGGCCRKKRHVVWKGKDGDIHSEYTSASDYTLQKFDKRPHHFRKRTPKKQSFLSHVDLYRGSGNVNMQTNGSESSSSENGVEKAGWTVGLVNGRYKYLTAETFGFKINANGASLKKKQLWTLEGCEQQVFLRSHLDRYLAVDQFGNVTCEAEDNSDPGCAFQIQVAADGSGRWALKNVQRGYFLGSSSDELRCTAKAPGDAEYWLVHLAARPQVNLRSAGRKRFAHLSAAQDEIHVDAPIPWGEDTLFTLEFRPSATADTDTDARGDAKGEGGHYALHTCNNKYLARDGKLLDSCTRECLYAAEFHAGLLALRDVYGAYLAPIGSKAVLKSRSNTVTRDELFTLEDSLPQASFVAALNQRYVSVKQGVDVTANQDEISGHETFQLEFDRATKRWYIRTMQDRYWTLEAGGGIQASDHKRSSNALFDLVWQPEDGTVALRANNGKFLATKRSGHLYANADGPSGGDSDACKYHFYLMNRPVLVLRCEQGFVGLKSAASPKLECNKAAYETIRVERCDRGIVRFKGQNGKYWHGDSESVTADSDVPTDGFYLELREPSRLCIKSTDGRYLTAGKNGVFRLGDTDYETATKWEF